MNDLRCSFPGRCQSCPFVRVVSTDNLSCTTAIPYMARSLYQLLDHRFFCPFV